MTDPQIALSMLGIFIFIIILGFPICFTLIAMGVGFGYYAYYDAERMNSIFDNRVFDLLVNQTYSVMINDVLVAVPLFLFIGYVVERANIVDRLFYSINIAARAVPGSLAVAALLTSAIFATAVGIVGAVVTLMGLLAFPVMLKAGYDEKFSAGVICAGGCLGILIPPSIMLIVYAAASGVSVVKLYAGAMFPGAMLAGLYIVYVMGRAMINPKLAPKPPKEQTDIPFKELLYMLLTSFIPLALLIMSVLGAILFGLATPTEAAAVGALGSLVLASGYRLADVIGGNEVPEWVARVKDTAPGWMESIGLGSFLVFLLYLLYVVFQILGIVFFDMPLPEERQLPGGPGLAILVALSAGVGFHLLGDRLPLLAWLRPTRAPGRALMKSAAMGGLGGLAVGLVILFLAKVIGLEAYLEDETLTIWAADVGFFLGMLGFLAWRGVVWEKLKEAVYLTVRTSAMVCWLFVGSWTFASVFSYLGGHSLIEEFVLGLDLSPVMFLILAQIIIFLLGWPLEWSEIIIIFVPIFLPMLDIFGIDPLFFGILVALNLQTSFLTPPMAMAAYYLKGVAPPNVELITIFRGCMPFLSMVLIAMVLIYNFPEIVLWLPDYFYGVR